MFEISGGNDGLVQAFVKELGDCLHQEHIVEQVSQDEAGVTVMGWVGTDHRETFQLQGDRPRSL